MPLTMLEDWAFKRGMKYRRDGVTFVDLKTNLDDPGRTDTTVYDNRIVEGWQFMDHLILGLDMLEGKA